MIETIYQICKTIEDAVEDVDERYEHFVMLQNALRTLVGYVDAVYDLETSMPILRFMMEGTDFTDAVTHLESARRYATEAAIASLRATNRMCDKLGAPALFAGDLEDRSAVAEFCMSSVAETFVFRNNANAVSLAEIAPGIVPEDI